MKFSLPEGITSKVAMATLKVQKNSPTLLVAGGIVGVVGTVVLASRATLKLSDVVDETKTKLDQVEEAVHRDDLEYTAEDAVKDKAIIHTQSIIRIAKLYAPAAGLGVISIAMLVGSHNILSKRNAALTAAYATIEKSFRSYRDRVIEDLGEEKDLQYYYNICDEQVVEVDEDGKENVVTKKVAKGPSAYGKLFHEGNPNWSPNPEYNYLFLRANQRFLNDKLRARGHVFLNEVYDALGYERTPAGQAVGWLAEGKGDGYIDFGIFEDADTDRIKDYMMGNEGELYLDFNVDGNIYEEI